MKKIRTVLHGSKFQMNFRDHKLSVLEIAKKRSEPLHTWATNHRGDFQMSFLQTELLKLDFLLEITKIGLAMKKVKLACGSKLMKKEHSNQ